MSPSAYSASGPRCRSVDGHLSPSTGIWNVPPPWAICARDRSCGRGTRPATWSSSAPAPNRSPPEPPGHPRPNDFNGSGGGGGSINSQPHQDAFSGVTQNPPHPSFYMRVSFEGRGCRVLCDGRGVFAETSPPVTEPVARASLPLVARHQWFG